MVWGYFRTTKMRNSNRGSPLNSDFSGSIFCISNLISKLFFIFFSFFHHWLLFKFLPAMATNDSKFEMCLPVSEWDFYRDLIVFDYCLLPVIDFNITCLKICFRFFFLVFSFFFVPFAPTYVVFLFLFFFSISFPPSSSFLCLDIFKLFSFHSHKLSLFFFLFLSCLYKQ